MAEPALTLLATVKAEIPGLVGVSADAELSRLIREVTGFVESFCSRYLLYGEYTEIFDGQGECHRSPALGFSGYYVETNTPHGSHLLLRGFPVESITYLKIAGEEIPAADYKVNLPLGEIYYESEFPQGFQNIEVKYKCGYDINTTGKHPPAEMEGAIISEVIARYLQKSTQPQPAGEGFVDRRTSFLTASSLKYFESQRNISL